MNNITSLPSQTMLRTLNCFDRFAVLSNRASLYHNYQVLACAELHSQKAREVRFPDSPDIAGSERVSSTIMPDVPVRPNLPTHCWTDTRAISESGCLWQNASRSASCNTTPRYGNTELSVRSHASFLPTASNSTFALFVYDLLVTGARPSETPWGYTSFKRRVHIPRLCQLRASV
jgi:hypothetical protein